MSSKYARSDQGPQSKILLSIKKSMLPLFLVSQLWLYLGNSQVSVYRTIVPLVKMFRTNELLISGMLKEVLEDTLEM